MIEMGKKYQTRDGRAVRVLCVDGPHPAYPVIGIIDSETEPDMWTEYGQFVEAGLHIADFDLVPVPTKHEGWMQWGSCIEADPAVITKEDAVVIPLSTFLKRLPKNVHEIHLTWES